MELLPVLTPSVAGTKANCRGGQVAQAPHSEGSPAYFKMAAFKFLILKKGSHISILHWVLPIIEQILPGIASRSEVTSVLFQGRPLGDTSPHCVPRDL